LPYFPYEKELEEELRSVSNVNFIPRVRKSALRMLQFYVGGTGTRNIYAASVHCTLVQYYPNAEPGV
jgi:hypothetical protein